MNILVSYNWLKEYLPTKLSAEEFAIKTTTIGNSVEQTDIFSHRWDKIVVGEVMKIKDHPDADRLKVVETKIGLMKKVDIVCGGINLQEGMKVAVALPESKVIWHGEGEPVEMKISKVRGVESYGMICAATELGLAKYPQGEKDIWDISALTKESAGVPLYKALGLDDVIFDIEVTTNRPDAASIIGQAREAGTFTKEKCVCPIKDVLPDSLVSEM